MSDSPGITESSKKQYKKAYDNFIEWCAAQGIQNDFSEQVLLWYFTVLADSGDNMSTLWRKYSMIKALIIANHGVDMQSYTQVRQLIKKTGEGCVPKHTKVFAPADVEKFIKQAPDEKYLVVKLVLIIGIKCSCLRTEFINLRVNDVEDTGRIFLIYIEGQKKTFPIEEEEYVRLLRKYIAIRPPGPACPRFFLKYADGRCRKQPVGINTIGRFVEMIAKFLRLPDWKEYTSASMRRTGQTLKKRLKRGSRCTPTRISNVIDDAGNSNINISGATEMQHIKIEGKSDSDPDEDPLPIEAIDMPINNIIKVECLEYENDDTYDANDTSGLDIKTENTDVADEDMASDDYQAIYHKFCKWRLREHKTSVTTEDILIDFFKRECHKYTPTALLHLFSEMMRFIQQHESGSLEKFIQVLEFLRNCSTDYHPQSKLDFTKQNFMDFIITAPDEDYLHIKVALILAAYGGLSLPELRHISMDNIEEVGAALIIKTRIPDTSLHRISTTTNQPCVAIYRRYVSKLPADGDKLLFVQYAEQIVRFPSIIANFLKLPDADKYNAHCFRQLAHAVNKSEAPKALTLRTPSSANESSEHNGDVYHTAEKEVCISKLEDKVVNVTGNGVVIKDCINCTFNFSFNSN